MGEIQEIMSFEEFMQKILAWLLDLSMSFGARLIGCLAVLVIGLKSVRWVLRVLRKTKKFQHIDHGAETFIFSFLSTALRLIVILTAIAILGVPMTNLVAILGSAGLAAGLALQGSLSNLAGGLMILVFHPFKAGDFITSNGSAGTVKEITILYTVIDTPDNVRIVIPNGTLSNAVIENYSANAERRVDFEFCVAYDTDIGKAKKTLRTVAETDERILKDNDVFIEVSAYEESAIRLKMRVWVRSSDYWNTFYDVMGKVKSRFDEQGVRIPYRQLDVHISGTDDPGAI